jgi:hypothetical protein
VDKTGTFLMWYDMHQKRALTLAPLGLSFEMSPLATAKTPSHNSYPAAQQRP